MKITNGTGYAITALTQLGAHQGDAPLSCHQLCAQTAMPERFVLQILRSLGKAGLVSSTRGVQGGFKLAKPLSQISVQTVCDAIEGPCPVGAPIRGGLTATSQRLLDKTLLEIANNSRRLLGELTLEKLHPSLQ